MSEESDVHRSASCFDASTVWIFKDPFQNLDDKYLILVIIIVFFFVAMPFETTAISILALFEDNSDVGLKLKIAITMDMARAQRFLDLGNLAVRSISLGIYI